MNFEECWHCLNLIGFKKIDPDYSLNYNRLKRHQYQQARDNIEKLFSDSKVFTPIAAFGLETERERLNWAMWTNYHEPVKPRRDRRIEIKAPKVCVRCGRTEHLEREHIIALADGGDDKPENLQWMCAKCHDYKHAREKVLSQIRDYKEAWRKEMWQYRLEALDRLNPPTEEKFHSYGEDFKTSWTYWDSLRKKRARAELEKKGRTSMEQYITIEFVEQRRLA